MARAFGGILAASVALYMWGFVYWGMGPYATMIWKQANDGSAAAEALKTHFPENGVYMVPAMANGDAMLSPEEMEQQFSAGPVAMVHMTAVDGRPAFAPSIMIGGAVANLAFIVVVAVLLRMVATSLPRYLDRVQFVAVAGLACAVLSSGGDVAWWQIDVAWMVYVGVYLVSAWIVVGLTLGCPCFCRSKSEAVALKA